MRQLTRLTVAEQIEVLQGLVQLRKDGHFHAIYSNGEQLRVQYEFDGPILLLGWRKALEMVTAAKEAAAAALEAENPALRKPPTGERTQRAVAGFLGSSGKLR